MIRVEDIKKGIKKYLRRTFRGKIHSYLYSNFPRGPFSEIHPDWKGKEV